VRYDFSLVADHAEIRDDKLDIQGGGFTRIDFDALPSVAPSVSLVARFLVDEGDADADHHLRFRIADPAGSTIAETPDSLVPSNLLVRPEAEPDSTLSLVVVVTIGLVTFTHPGAHEFELYMDDEVVKTHPIEIRVRRNPEPVAGLASSPE
jgi:hypothetical protein